MMWWRKRKELERRCADIEEVLLEGKIERKLELGKKVDCDDLAICELCGCLLWKRKAIKGKGEVRGKPWWPHEEYIYHPYYCKIHAPKEEEKEENKS